MHYTWGHVEESFEEEISFALNKCGDDYYPKNIFIFTHLTPWPIIKAVIVGQDPYESLDRNTGLPKAQGYCFGTDPKNQVPPSLKNIFSECERSIVNFKIPNTPDIRLWATRGVLLLNMALTVEPGISGSHNGIWLPFTTKLIELINSSFSNLVFFLWGGKAQKIESYLSSSKHCILKSSHPSPLSVSKGKTPFKGNNHFVLCNEYLKEVDIEEIDWTLC